MKNKKFNFSICLPVYKGSSVLRRALASVFKQNFQDFEVVIGDDNPKEAEKETQKTQKIINSFQDGRIKYFQNKKNLGYPQNLQKIVSQARNEVIFLLAQDDILASKALQKTSDGFFLDKNIGVVTRPYFWFDKDVNKPVRAVLPYNEKKDFVLSVFDEEGAIKKIFESIGQLSGLAYRRKFLEILFGDEVFTAHIYPFLGILKKHKCVFLKDYTVAVAIKSSQTRTLSSIYDVSPTESWVRMFNTVFAEKKYERVKRIGVRQTATNFVGLVQLKNYGKRVVLEKEILILLKYYWQNIFDLKFWFFALGTLLAPRLILRLLVDFYKANINAKFLPKIIFGKKYGQNQV